LENKLGVKSIGTVEELRLDATCAMGGYCEISKERLLEIALELEQLRDALAVARSALTPNVK
jgi:hypothetical protein